MKDPDEHVRKTEARRERLSRLSEASLRINESLDLDSVLQEVVDSAPRADGLSLRDHHHPGRLGAAQGLLHLRDEPGDPPGPGGLPAGGPAGLPVSERPAGAAPHRQLRRAHRVAGALRLPARSGELLPDGAHPPCGKDGGQHLRGQAGAGRRVHPGGRGDPGDVRLAGGAGHRQRPPAPE